MATSLMRRREGREPMTTGRGEPLRSLRDWDPFAMMRELLRWDPFSDLEPLASPEMAFVPRVNLRERPEGYEITMELAGIQPDDIEITYTGNQLTVSGERRGEERDESERYHAFERFYGRFSRSFMLPEGADFDKVRAELRDGVLRIAVPKHPGVQAKRIPVEVIQGAQEAQQIPQQQGAETQQGEEKQVKVEKKAA